MKSGTSSLQTAQGLGHSASFTVVKVLLAMLDLKVTLQ